MENRALGNNSSVKGDRFTLEYILLAALLLVQIGFLYWLTFRYQ